MNEDEFATFWAVEEQNSHTGDWFPVAVYMTEMEAEQHPDPGSLRVKPYKAFACGSDLSKDVRLGVRVVEMVRGRIE